MKSTRCGYVGVLGRPNVGKSTLLNKLAGMNLAMVSHKVNATRKRMFFIASYEDQDALSQIIFIDSPGLQQGNQGLLDQFMFKEAMKTYYDSDLVLFITTPMNSLREYEEFLSLAPREHIVLVNKIDLIPKEKLLSLMDGFKKYQENFLALIPVSAKKDKQFEHLLSVIHMNLPQSPFLYNSEDLTTSSHREICAGLIRESIFKNLSDEIPYQSEVAIENFFSNEDLIKIYAKIFVQKESQRSVVIGKKGNTIRRVGSDARLKIESFLHKKVFLHLDVCVENWARDKFILKKFGYDLDL